MKGDLAVQVRGDYVISYNTIRKNTKLGEFFAGEEEEEIEERN